MIVSDISFGVSTWLGQSLPTQQDATELIREHAAFVWRVLRHVGVDENQLEDLSQEVFIAIVQQLPTFEARASVRTWIYGICWNVASTARRRARVRSQPQVEPMTELSIPASQDREVWIKQAHAELVQALEALEPEQRTVSSWPGFKRA